LQKFYYLQNAFNEIAFKGSVQCFSQQVVMCKTVFSLEPRKKLANIRAAVFEKNVKIA